MRSKNPNRWWWFVKSSRDSKPTKHVASSRQRAELGHTIWFADTFSSQGFRKDLHAGSALGFKLFLDRVQDCPWELVNVTTMANLVYLSLNGPEDLKIEAALLWNNYRAWHLQTHPKT